MRTMSDSRADMFLFIALLAWVLCCFHPAFGLMVQVPIIIMLVARCDFKSLPALLILMFGKGNIPFFSGSDMLVLRLGITLKPENVFVISTFIFAAINLIKNRYDSPSVCFAFFWFLALIPAAVMSFTAKRYGLAGIWSAPIMDAIAPSVYYWGMSMASSYRDGKYYFTSRIAWIMMGWNLFMTLNMLNSFSFIPVPLSIGLFVYVYGDPELRRLRPLCLMMVAIALANFVFMRQIRVSAAAEELGKDVSAADKSAGGTFSTMISVGISIVLITGLRKWMPNVFARALPIVMTAANILLVTFVVSTQSGNQAKETSQAYYTMEERFNYKLFGDRGTVWMMGWEEVKDPPYIFKDLRKFLEVNRLGVTSMKLLPHNQFLTLLGREGFWLGLTLSIFIIWVQVRMFRCYTRLPEDRMFSRVFLPVSAAIFFACGTAGQSVATSDLWGNSLATMVMPGIVYGQWLLRKNAQRLGYFNCGDDNAYPMA